MAKYVRYISREMAENSAEYHAAAILSAEAKIAKLQATIEAHRRQIDICNENMVKADARKENTRIKHENHLAKLEAQTAKARRRLEVN